MKSALDTLKTKALENRVPIIQDDSLELLVKVLRETNSRSLLEVGTAIGYSALSLKYYLPHIDITTLERDTIRYDEAIINVRDFNQEKNIKLVLDDALEYNPITVYDAIFIDGAKAQNLSFFRLYFAYTDKIMIIDNTNYHGFVKNEEEKIRSRRLRQMIDKIRSFREYLETRDDLIVTYYDVGDGMITIQRKLSMK